MDSGAGASCGHSHSMASSSTGCRILGSFYRAMERFSYRKISPRTALFVIKTGTFCRTMWPLLPPLLVYQWIRQTDEEMKSIEYLQNESGSTNALSFYDTRKANGTGHWRLQQDLAVIHHRVNNSTEDSLASPSSSTPSVTKEKKAQKTAK
ncbi:hypothetical protein CSUI_001058 [Cystoisospora suis]|uniref:Uncharacterized protein n=1 Tax=Cystoisospora suis TaxID=483139 RepID=A0A2C6LDS6_9APIC|nr:hypothetical protein CSUI_001058 [Cystoisospora suis]